MAPTRNGRAGLGWSGYHGHIVRSTPMSRAILVTGAVLVSLIGAGCASQSQDSAGDFSGEERAVAQTIEDLQEAGGDQDAEKICNDIVTSQLAEQLSGGKGKTGCADRLDTSLEDVDQAELSVEDVTVSGTTATARVEQGTGDQTLMTTMKLEKVGPIWRVADLGTPARS